MPDHLSKARSIHRRLIEPSLGPAVGATAEEIAILEAQLGYALPAAYRQFLQWMGRDTNGAFRGTDCLLEHVTKNNRYLPALLRENGITHRIPDRIVTFWMHQGYEAAWFSLETHDDDPVCSAFSEGTDEGIGDVGTFSDFLASELEALAPAIQSVTSSKRGL